MSLIKVCPSTGQEDARILVKDFQHYYEAIVMDDDVKVKDILIAQKDPAVLLNSEFDFQYDRSDKSRKVKRVCLPFHLAVAFGSAKVAEVMIDFGVDTQKKDCHQRNVLHNFSTLVAYVLGHGEDIVCKMIPWMIAKLGIDVLYKMSRDENEDGLRPVEYAAQQNTLKLMKTLLETRGLYVDGGVPKGDTHFLDLDVTEYETGERYSKSPLNMLAYLDSKKLSNAGTVEFIQSSIFKSWMAAKMKTNAMPLLLWVMYRLLLLICYIVTDVNVKLIKDLFGENSSKLICEELGYVEINYTGTLSMIIIMIVVMGGSLILTTIIYFRDYKVRLFIFKYNIYGKKTLASNTGFFHVQELIFCLAMISAIVLFFDTMSNGASDKRALLFAVTRLIIPLVCTWLIIYFLQLVPLLGSFIVSVQGMIADMMRFLLLFLIMMLPFAHAIESFVMTNSREGCIDDFSSIFKTCYTLFKMMLNMHDLSQHDINNVGVLYVMHIIFVFMMVVLLINFLIAIMSSSASKIALNEQVILSINQLSVLVELERYLFWAKRWIYPYLCRMGFPTQGKKVILRFEKCRLAELLTAKGVL